MNKEAPVWLKILGFIGIIVGAFFLGSIAIAIIQGLGDWYTKQLTSPPLWRWYLYATVTGLLLIGLWKTIEKMFSEADK